MPAIEGFVSKILATPYCIDNENVGCALKLEYG